MHYQFSDKIKADALRTPWEECFAPRLVGQQLLRSMELFVRQVSAWRIVLGT
jgi:hypothetical protein